MNVLFLTKSKKYTCLFLEYLISNHNVVGVVGKNEDILVGTEMEALCKRHNIRIYSNNEMYELLANGEMPQIDLAISNTYGRLIKKPLLDFVHGNCINFHGAILPQYQGLFPYNHGILNAEKEWGVTAHYVNEEFDKGAIIDIKRFPINPDTISVSELEQETQKTTYELSIEILEKWEEEGPLSATPQDDSGTYYSREDFEREKEVFITDSADTVKRKIQAFWCPPHEGAYIKIDGVKVPLMPLREKDGYDK